MFRLDRPRPPSSDEPTTLRTRSENQPSSPTLTVSTAKTATRTVGTSAISAKTPGQPQVQPRPGRARAAVGDHAHHAGQNQRRHDEDVDEVGQQDEPQRRRRRALIERPKREEGRQRQERAQQRRGRRSPHVWTRRCRRRRSSRSQVSPRAVRCTPIMPFIAGRTAPHTAISCGLLPADAARATLAVAVLHQLAATCHANIKIGDLLAQGIAIDAEKIGAFRLIAGGGIQRNLDQRQSPPRAGCAGRRPAGGSAPPCRSK